MQFLKLESEIIDQHYITTYITNMSNQVWIQHWRYAGLYESGLKMFSVMELPSRIPNGDGWGGQLKGLPNEGKGVSVHSSLPQHSSSHPHPCLSGPEKSDWCVDIQLEQPLWWEARGEGGNTHKIYIFKWQLRERRETARWIHNSNDAVEARKGLV